MKKIQISFTASQQLITAMDQKATEKSLSRSEYIRKVLEDSFESNEVTEAMLFKLHEKFRKLRETEQEKQ